MESPWPAYTRHLKEILCRPYLYLDQWRFTALRGEALGDDCAYEGLTGPLSLMCPSEYSLLRRGNFLSLKKTGVNVYKNGKLLGNLPSPHPRLFPFKDSL